MITVASSKQYSYETLNEPGETGRFFLAKTYLDYI